MPKNPGCVELLPPASSSFIGWICRGRCWWARGISLEDDEIRSARRQAYERRRISHVHFPDSVNHAFEFEQVDNSRNRGVHSTLANGRKIDGLKISLEAVGVSTTSHISGIETDFKLVNEIYFCGVQVKLHIQMPFGIPPPVSSTEVGLNPGLYRTTGIRITKQ